MKINSFILPKSDKGERFEYGVKLIPNRTLDRLTDSMVISTEKSIQGKDLFNMCFKKKQNTKLVVTKFILTTAQFENYIYFLSTLIDTNNAEKEMKTEFIIEDVGKIIISSLNKDYIKISSEKVESGVLVKVFFTLLRTEMLTYIEALNGVYSGKEITSLLTYQMGYLINPLSKLDRDEVYLDALYVFINWALDNRNRELFQLLTKEAQRVLNS